MRVLVGLLVLFSGCQESQSKEKYDVWTNGKKDIVMDKFAFEVYWKDEISAGQDVRTPLLG